LSMGVNGYTVFKGRLEKRELCLRHQESGGRCELVQPVIKEGRDTALHGKGKFIADLSRKRESSKKKWVSAAICGGKETCR